MTGFTPDPDQYGVTTYSSTTASTSTADVVNFLDRYNYVTITNDGTVVIYARADQPVGGTTATVAGLNCYAIPPGESRILANGLPMWFQSSRVLQKGVIQVGNGAAYDPTANPSTPSNPGTVTPMESLAGQMANPGTVVSLISATSGQAYTVAAAG